MEKKKLTPRQWALYRLVKANTDAGRKTTQAEICESIEGYHYVETGHDRCRTVWEDINGVNGLNFSPEVEKTIISDDFSYWIGNEEECQDYLNKLWNGIAPRLRRYRDLLERVSKDGQGKLIGCDGGAIGEGSNARRFIEAFMEHPELED